MSGQIAVTDRLDPRLDSRRYAPEAGASLLPCDVCEGTGIVAPVAPCLDAAECSVCGGTGVDWGL